MKPNNFIPFSCFIPWAQARKGVCMITILLLILLVLLIGSLFYRPYGTGYLSYGPSGILLFLLLLFLVLQFTGVLR